MFLFLIFLSFFTFNVNNTLTNNAEKNFYFTEKVYKDVDFQDVNKLNLDIRNFSAESILIKEIGGQTLLSKNSLAKKDIASITKLLSVYIGYLVFKENKDFYFDKESLSKEGIVGYFKEGERISRDDIFKAVLIASSNDSIYLLAKNYNVKDFVSLMNLKAKEFGMLDSKFVDPSGLEQNLSTAKDLFILLVNLYSRIPEILRITTLEKVVINNKTLWTTNLILHKYKNFIVASKTGYKDEVGENLVMILKFDKSPFLAFILLGSKNRWQETEMLISSLIKYYGQ